MDDIFEKIIAREIPASIIYEDDVVISFLDIKPVNKGHTLVVPKRKFRNILDADPETLQHMILIAQKIARASKAAFKADGISIFMNNEKAGGQDVFHAHIHVIPRFTDDGSMKQANHVSYEDGEMQDVAERLRKELS